MKKLYTLFLLAGLLAASSIHAQQLLQGTRVNVSKKKIIRSTNESPETEKCGFALMMQKAKVSGFNETLFEQHMAELTQQRIATSGTSRPTAIYTVPVIFHIIYQGSTESTIGTGSNLYQDLIDSQIVQLNKDYANLSGSSYGVAQDMGIRFVPAKVNPVGTVLCEPGIERIDWETRAGWQDPTSFTSNATLMSYFDATVKPQSIWDPYRYLNVWLADFSSTTLLGYATFPAFSTLSGLDNAETDQTAGVVLLSYSVGSITNPGLAYPYDYGRTATHEIGHFFGLRHIWGDANCGEDYCGDTPKQDAATSGCPAAGTLNNCSPSAAKMFENYMDYTDDACLNTFTNNQSQRCQTVMLNSPRRITLATSNVGVSTMPNRIFFRGITAGTVRETSSGACPKYKDITLTVGVESAANGNATVSLSKSGTATDGADYTILQPSVSYTNGDASNKTFTVRIYDDPAVEGNETIILNLNISSGSGVQLLPGCTALNQTSITILDDDVSYLVNNTAPAISTLFSENFGTATASGALPAGWLKGSFISPAGANVWTVNNQYGAATGFSTGTNGRVLHITNGNASAQTAETAPATYTATSPSDAAVISPSINTTGYQNIRLSFDYAINGEEDADGIYDYGLIRYSTTAQTSGLAPATDANGNIIILRGVTGKTSVSILLPPATWNTGTLWVGFEWVNDGSIGNNPPFIIDNIVVTGENTGVETVLNQAVTLQSDQGNTVQFISNTNKIIASISNLNTNIGCITATVTSAGTSQAPLTTNTGVYQRTDKVIKLTPAVPNSSATYQVTYYYTTAEMAVWGGNVSGLKLVKVNEGVNLSSTLNGSNAQIFNTTVDDQRATKGYVAFTANVTGGFSQFMLASPTITIPVTLLSFEATGNRKNILLNWSTSTESNNKGFVVERSINGIDFERIGWVNGIGNSSQLSNYAFTDNFVQPEVVYYYRLRQTDTDNREKLSAIKSARIRGAGTSISITPNPATDQVKVFVSGFTGTVNIDMINAEGQLMRTWNQVNVTNGPAKLDISGLARGVYMLKVATNQTTTVEKLIIN